MWRRRHAAGEGGGSCAPATACASAPLPTTAPSARDAPQVTKAFLLYIVADWFWILIEPRAVPSKWVLPRAARRTPRIPCSLCCASTLRLAPRPRPGAPSGLHPGTLTLAPPPALPPPRPPCRPRIILWHHAVTFLLLQIPLKHPQLGRYTCMVRPGGVGGSPAGVALVLDA